MILRFADCEVDLLSGELRRQGALVPIQAKPFLLLVYLIRNRDRLVEYGEILDELWHGTIVGDAAPRRAMKLVRRAVGDDGVSQRLFRTIRGRGYRFVAEVDEVENAEIDARARSRATVRAAELPAGALVGRDRLMARAAATLERLGGGSGGLILLSGEGGSGKTRALAEIGRLANGRRIEVHYGSCSEEEGAPPYWPWAQIVRSLLASRGFERVHEAAGAALADLAGIDSGLLSGRANLEAAPRIAQADSSFRLRDSATRLLTTLAREQPMVVEIDDLHGADPASLKLLIHLARELPKAPLLVVGAFRDFETGLDARRLELLGELERRDPGATIELSPLEIDDIELLAKEQVGEDVPRSLLREIHDRSGGNPFFVKQILGLLRRREGRLEIASLSEGASQVRLEAIGLHTARLAPETLEVLRIAAMIGRRFTPGVLFLSLEEGAGAPARALADAVRAGVIRAEPQRVNSYRFVHALVAEALRESGEPAWRARAHARIGTALEQLADSLLGARDAELAHHFLEAGRGYEEKAIAYQRRAGSSARVRAASHEAVMHYERAVQILDGLEGHEVTRCETLIDLGEARTEASDMVGGRESLLHGADLARRLDRRELFSRAAISYSDEIAVGVLEPRSIDLLEEALRWVRSGASRGDQADDLASRSAGVIESRLLSRLACARYYVDSPEIRASRAAEAVEIAVRSGDLRAHALALKDYHDCLMGAAPARDRAHVADQLAELARRLGDRELSAWSEEFRIEDALELGESERVGHHCDVLEMLGDELRHPLFRCHSLHHRAMRAHRAGLLAEAERSAEQGLELGLHSEHQVALQFFGVQLWSLRRDQGRLAELEPQVLRLSQSVADNSGWRAALAYDYMQRGDHRSAAEILARLVDRERESIRSSINWTTTPALLAEVAFRLGDEVRAGRLYEDLAPHLGAHVIVSHSMADFGPVERYLGLCAATFDVTLARGHLQSALEACNAARLLPISTAIRLDLAQVLLGREREAALQLAGRARSDASRMGILSVARAADRFLAAA